MDFKTCHVFSQRLINWRHYSGVRCVRKIKFQDYENFDWHE